MSPAGPCLEHRRALRARRARPSRARVAPAAGVAGPVPRAPRVVAVFVGGAGTRASAEAPRVRRRIDALVA